MNASQVDVGIQTTRNKVIVIDRRVMERNGRVEQFVLARDGKDLFGRLANNLAARVRRTVDPVAEPGQDDFLGLDFFEVRGDVLGLADRDEHADHGFVGTWLR
jgi:hypothetical protein